MLLPTPCFTMFGQNAIAAGSIRGSRITTRNKSSIASIACINTKIRLIMFWLKILRFYNDFNNVGEQQNKFGAYTDPVILTSQGISTIWTIQIFLPLRENQQLLLWNGYCFPYLSTWCTFYLHLKIKKIVFTLC